jgi:hypothetical protein
VGPVDDDRGQDPGFGEPQAALTQRGGVVEGLRW